jgi:hypothetical protein
MRFEIHTAANLVCCDFPYVVANCVDGRFMAVMVGSLRRVTLTTETANTYRMLVKPLEMQPAV